MNRAESEITELEIEWARSQIESMADGDLEGVELERMQTVLARVPELRRQLQDAVNLLEDLQSISLSAPRRGFLFRLLTARQRSGRGIGQVSGVFSGLSAPVFGVLSISAIAFAFTSLTARMPDPAAEAAMRDFEVAMGYLRRSAVMAQDQVGQQVGYGLSVAMTLSTESLADRQINGDNGG